MSSPVASWRIWSNPLVIKGMRQRLRRGTLISAGAVTLIITAFIFFFVYLALTQRGKFTAENAAKMAFLPIFILQCFIMMFLGTGGVATGITEERAEGLLDYHRLTPMSPTTKIVGYLFGLASREYYMFSLTLPFVAFSVVFGGINPLKVLQLYVVFFSSVILYHLAGLVAGMVAKKPRRASWTARIMVITLYLLLPMLGKLGFAFLSYFTVAPTFNGLIREETLIAGLTSVHDLNAIATSHLVPFFSISISPSLYTLLMEGVLIATFFAIVHRKWREESNHAISKSVSLMLFGTMQFLVVGSLWAFFSTGKGAGFAQINLNASPQERVARMMLLFYVFFAISALTSLLLIYIVTPIRDTFLKGLRRARKLGLAGIPWTSDAAPSLAYAGTYFLFTMMSYAVLASLAQGSQVFYRGSVDWTRQLYPLLMLASTMIYVQAVREYWSSRAFFGFLGIVWVLPMMLAMLVGIAVRDATTPLYLLTPTPPAGFVYAMLHAFEPVLTPSDAKALTLGGHQPALTYVSLIWSVGFAVFFSTRLWARERRDITREMSKARLASSDGIAAVRQTES
ncbi:MAG: hypothetical protein KC609_25330 [Myxococcales bacterium]|nr:hypothetical protein [Myxococcales bacterium]